MPNTDNIDAWDKAFNDLLHARENLKATLGTQAEASAMAIYKLTKAKYDTASDALD